MRKLLLFLFLSLNLQAKPLDEMAKRLAQLQATAAPLICDDSGTSDMGLFVDISCDLKCVGKNNRVERIKGSFMPQQLGLTAGNGSTKQKIIWSSVGVTLKTWSQDICLKKGAEVCHGLDKTEASSVAQLESGKWSLNRFPGCKEKSPTLSPFDNSSGASRINSYTSDILVKLASTTSQTNYSFHAPNTKINLPFAPLDSPGCKHKIKGKICFGDCVDMNNTKDIKETIATNDPLGTDEIELCGDEWVKHLKDKNLSPAVKQQLCENYFWDSLAAQKLLYSTCAAIRGSVSCN